MKRRITRIGVGSVAGLMLLIGVALAYAKLPLPNVGSSFQLTIRTDATPVKPGRYLVNPVASCIDRHSTRDFSKRTVPMVAGTEGEGLIGHQPRWTRPVSADALSDLRPDGYQ